MKKIMLALLAMALSIPAIAFAQSSTQDQQTQQNRAQQNQAAQVNQEGMTTMPKQAMSGVVSNNGKTLTSDNKSYQVSNGNSLKKYDGQTVMVQYVMDTEKNTIHILSVSPSESRGSSPQQ